MRNELFNKRYVSFHTSYSEFIQRPVEFLTSSFECSCIANNLTEERIIVRRYNSTLMTHSINSDTETSWSSINSNTSSIWLEAFLWIFSRDSALDSMSIALHIFLLHFQILEGRTTSNHDLLLNDIDTCYLLCNCMFNLDSWIYFNKVKCASIFFNQKFNGTRINIPNMLSKSDCA